MAGSANAYDRAFSELLTSAASGLNSLASALSGLAVSARETGAAAGEHPTLTATPRLQQLSAAPVSHGAFDSIAIPVGHIGMTAQWADLRSADYAGFFTPACDLRFTSACNSAFGRAMEATYRTAQSATPLEMLALVNRQVNGAIAYQSDAANWGSSDYWATPAEIARSGRGDCEDYATTKMWLLLALGFSPDQLQLVILQDTRRGLYHAVLAVHMEGKRYILDNLSDRVRLDQQIGNYMPLVSFVADRTFIHGFNSSRAATAALPTDLTTVQPG